MGEFSLTHILLVLIVFLVFFGPKRLPQLGQSLGEAIRGFKDAMNGENQQPNPPQQQASNPPPAPAQRTSLHEAPPHQGPIAHDTAAKKETVGGGSEHQG